MEKFKNKKFILFILSIILYFIFRYIYTNYMIATHQPKSDTKISDEKIILSNGDEILLKDGEFFSFKRAPYYTTIDDVTYKVITTYYDENKMIIGYLNEETQIMTIEWYEYNQLVNTHNFDLQGLPQGE